VIQSILIDHREHLDQNVDLIQKILGKDQIVAHLLTIKEIGTLNV
jgi:hypothetical protein